jgi:hypothetical protein
MSTSKPYLPEETATEIRKVVLQIPLGQEVCQQYLNTEFLNLLKWTKVERKKIEGIN